MSLKLVFSVTVALTLLLAMSSGEPLYAEQLSFRALVKCNHTETPGLSCLDCNTVLFCTKLGGFTTPCWWPGRTYCVDGTCGQDPSDECAPSTTTESATEAETPTSQWTLVPAE